MSKIVEHIRELIYALPKNDVNIALQLLENRDFDELEALIHSSIITINKNLKSSSPKEEYKIIDLDKLEDLESVVSAYNEEQYYDVQYDASTTDDRYYDMCRDNDY